MQLSLPNIFYMWLLVKLNTVAVSCLSKNSVNKSLTESNSLCQAFFLCGSISQIDLTGNVS